MTAAANPRAAICAVLTPDEEREYKRACNMLLNEITNNGGAGQLLAFQFGWHSPKAARWPRAAIARVCEAAGDTKAAEYVLDVTDEQALSRAINVSHGLCSKAGTAASGSAPVRFTVRRLETNTADVKSWGIYREDLIPGERESQWALGARVYSAPGGIFSADPIARAFEPYCRHIADAIAAHAVMLRTTLDAAGVSRLIHSHLTRNAGCATHICEGLKMGLASREETWRVVHALLALRAVTGAPIATEPRFKGGLSEQHVSESVVRQIVGQLEQFRSGMVKDQKSPPKRGVANVFRRRVDTARELRGEVERVRGLIGGWADRLTAECDKAVAAYNAAVMSESLDDIPVFDLDLAEDGGDEPVLTLPDAPEPPASLSPDAPLVLESPEPRSTGTDDPFAL